MYGLGLTPFLTTKGGHVGHTVCSVSVYHAVEDD